VPLRVTAFNHGDVDAAATWEPYLERIEEHGAKFIADGTDIKNGERVILATQDPWYLGATEHNPEIWITFLICCVGQKLRQELKLLLGQ
jgi:ABC-type nitrate/sulfonate/bicarbonate transport system substrate-binding protein